MTKKQTKTKFSLKKNIKRAGSILKILKIYFDSCWNFFAFTLIGFLCLLQNIFQKKIMDFIKEILLKTEGMSQSQLISFIFLNNVQSSFLSMIFGIFFRNFSNNFCNCKRISPWFCR